MPIHQTSHFADTTRQLDKCINKENAGVKHILVLVVPAHPRLPESLNDCLTSCYVGRRLHMVLVLIAAGAGILPAGSWPQAGEAGGAARPTSENARLIVVAQAVPPAQLNPFIAP